jgi:hypothetical protein
MLLAMYAHAPISLRLALLILGVIGGLALVECVSVELSHLFHTPQALPQVIEVSGNMG